MQKIQEALLPSDDQKKRRRLFVLSGLGGIGKTQLAVEFMRQYREQFSAILWLDGSTEDKLKQSMAKFAIKLSSDKIDTGRISHDTKDIDALIAHMLSWLSKANNDRWLIVFDNVNRDHRDSLDSLAYDIKRYFPTVDQGSILITTRLSQLEQLGESQQVQKVNDSIARKILGNWYKEVAGKFDEARLSCNIAHTI